MEDGVHVLAGERRSTVPTDGQRYPTENTLIMTSIPNSPIDELAEKIFGESISNFARGNSVAKKQATRDVHPTIAALQFPEEYAVLVLGTRMDAELETIIKNGLHKQGNAKRLLSRLFSNFATKIGVAYACGFITKQMYDALELVRKIRNLYAHSEDPFAVRASEEYKQHSASLLNLNKDLTEKSAVELHSHSLQADSDSAAKVEDFKLVGILVTICDRLGSAAFFSVNGLEMPQISVIPAFFALTDTPEMVNVAGHRGFFPNTSGWPQNGG
ncbi:hypothetical protein [Allorhodopirellula solitaria]|uniref:Uncharacterized protein n=1 Tax=Allorhodopirellula solitaria TaxID=2527987 RepID=A0A5C5XY49_9BACT|nr:hypothetical protein [Allorhodopirellula solitaria]TWT67489.1 hypothetical protein CA85_23400 [Allorhodopirellula solitaria]